MAKRFYNIAFLSILILASCSQPTDTKRVNAQMFLKVPLDEEGAIECFAEGKHYGILPVKEQTFYPDDDSFHKMHHHGVALESELMAYRIYFDKRQTIDVYAKRTPQLELAESLWYPNDSLLACGFGDDVLKVGSTIGVGSVRPWDEKKQKLQNMDKFTSRTQRIVSMTDTCAVAEVEVKGLQTEDKTVDMRTRYTILAGHRDMLCEVFISEHLGNLVTGVQRIGEDGICQKWEDTASAEGNEGIILASWGTDWPVNDTIKYAKETLGIAVIVPETYARETLSDNKQLLVYLSPEKNKEGIWYARFHLTTVSMKEYAPPAKNAEEFFNFVLSAYRN